jgi:hypothetical protein
MAKIDRDLDRRHGPDAALERRILEDSVKIIEAALVRRLKSRWRTKKSLTAEANASGASIMRDGVCIGSWRWVDGQLRFYRIGTAVHLCSANTLIGAASLSDNILDEIDSQ